jgi:hypothetical protein
MKYPLIVCCLSLILSCSNDPVTTPASQKINVIDSSIIKKGTVNPYVAVDVSPMDMAYFPTDYPVKKMNATDTALPVARVIYSRPHLGGRKLFGGLVKWGQPWRLGANEATEIRFFRPVTIQTKKIPVGQYSMYAVPYEDRWTIVFNSNLYSWGLKFDSAKDVFSFDIPARTMPRLIEHFTMAFEKTATGADLIMAWEDREARLPIQF